ncbi:DUF3363 domain-containing protein [Brevundimonas sp.]|uniref:DUF3363 domain-containing protein n=1 Tax=Brevundimonas sp. TaxID=1871086 RepID=UPI00121C0267|nr:DUF3363 domain-containing protein [Brevundimonas sp.]TAJ63994.1 MAG: DUF3363 domain-containing protein [Brevundimonas sp.]
MTEPRDPDLFNWRPPLTARRETPPVGRTARLVGRATPGMPPRARARHFSAKGSAQRVRPVRSATGGQRRVIVKARVVCMTPGAKKALMTHVRYVAREGAGAEGEEGRYFDARSDAADARAFAGRCETDRHHFRLIVNPEDGRDLPDLKAYARRFMAQVESDIGTPLDWVAGAHFDTGRPHLHILLRGKRDDGRDLVLPREYVSHGLRGRAQELATEILGPRQEQSSDMEREITADRFTRLDRTLLAEVRDGQLALGSLPPEQQSDALRRLVHLETRGWATREGPERWSVPADFRERLQSHGEREARERAATKALWGSPWSGQIDRLEPLELATGEAVTGAYVGVQPIGPYGSGPQALVLETFEGRLGHARLPGLDAALVLDRVPPGAIVQVHAQPRPVRGSDQTIAEVAGGSGGTYSAAVHRSLRPDDSSAFIDRHLRRLEAMSREGVCRSLGEGRFAIGADYPEAAAVVDRAKLGGTELRIQVRDPRPLEAQVRAQAFTWLDRCLRDQVDIPSGGRLAGEANIRLEERAGVLRAWGLGSGEPLRLGKTDETALGSMEVKSVFERLGAHGKPVELARAGQTFSGVYMEKIHVAGMPYAVVEGRHGITLAPWRAALEACRGQAMTGVLQGRSVDFRFGQQLGRGQGLEL